MSGAECDRVNIKKLSGSARRKTISKPLRLIKNKWRLRPVLTALRRRLAHQRRVRSGRLSAEDKHHSKGLVQTPHIGRLASENI